jgi:hypothetical protein
MFDKKKLEAYLDALAWDYGKVIQKRSSLDERMDKYDIFKQDDYQNVGTHEFPVLAKRNSEGLFSSIWSGSNNFWGGSAMKMPIQYAPAPAATWIYGGIQRAISAVYGFTDTSEAPPVPVETPHDKMKKNIAGLQGIESVKLLDPNPAPPEPEKSPDYVHTLTGWRGWEVQDGRLIALGSDYTWVPKMAMKATCRSDQHRAPQYNCRCGFWSFKTLDLMTEAVRSYIEDVDVIGTVEIWGRVIECENGFRAEYAYPKELWLLKPGLEHLSWDYGVPVRRIEKGIE